MATHARLGQLHVFTLPGKKLGCRGGHPASSVAGCRESSRRYGCNLGETLVWLGSPDACSRWVGPFPPSVAEKPDEPRPSRGRLLQTIGPGWQASQRQPGPGFFGKARGARREERVFSGRGHAVHPPGVSAAVASCEEREASCEGATANSLAVPHFAVSLWLAPVGGHSLDSSASHWSVIPLLAPSVGTQARPLRGESRQTRRKASPTCVPTQSVGTS